MRASGKSLNSLTQARRKAASPPQQPLSHSPAIATM